MTLRKSFSILSSSFRPMLVQSGIFICLLAELTFEDKI